MKRMENDNIEKVFYSGLSLTITNRRIERHVTQPVKQLYNKITSNPNHKTFDASSVKGIKDVVSPSYWLRIFGLFLTMIAVLIPTYKLLPSEEEALSLIPYPRFSFPEQIQSIDADSTALVFTQYLSKFVNSPEWIQIKEYLLNYGIKEETFFLTLFALTSITPIIIIVKLISFLLYDARYTLISFKDDSEIKLNNGDLTGRDGKEMVKSWLEAVSFGIIPNNAQEPLLIYRSFNAQEPLLIYRSLIISNDSFSIIPAKQFPIKAFNLTAIKTINEAPKDKSLLGRPFISSIFFSVIATLIITLPILLLLIYNPTNAEAAYLLKSIVDNGIIVEMNLLMYVVPTSIVSMVVGVFVYRLADNLITNRITIELNDGELFDMDGEGNWRGESQVKKALEKAIKNQ